MRIAVDFDGTIAVRQAHTGSLVPVPGAFEWMRKWQEAGAKLILWTMRSGSGGKFPLDDAVEFCRENGIEFYGVNQGPGDREWTKSPKVFAQVYVDDAAFGCPLIHFGGHSCVDWSVVGPTIIGKLKQ